MIQCAILLLLLMQGTRNSECKDQKSIAEKVFAQVNKERQKKGLDVLTWNSKLESATKLHATQMATLNFFSHYHPSNKAYYAPSDRIKHFQYKFRLNGENNATQSYSPSILPSEDEIASKFVYIWVNSSVHYKMMFHKEFVDAAVTIISVPRPGGIVKYYAVMNFGVQ
jgi:uncharacterized protein YkwD